MEINGPGPVGGLERLEPVQPSSPADQTSQASGVGGSDEVTISEEAQLLARVNDIPDIRQDVVDQIRTEIADGTYETEDKLDTAISRLLDEIA
ncbi:MAG: flagellar biosynthesis anti-sigma factor FlgM [Pirellulales bacterium]